MSIIIGYLVLSAIIAFIHLIIYMRFYKFEEGDTILFLTVVTLCWPVFIIFEIIELIVYAIKRLCK